MSDGQAELDELKAQLADQRAELTGQLSEHFQSLPACYATPADHYREMARRLVEDRDAKKHALRQAEAERDRLREGLQALVDRWEPLAAKPLRGVPSVRSGPAEIFHRCRTELATLLAEGAAPKGPTQPKFPPIQLQDGKSPEWTCQTCGGDLLFCQCPKEIG